LNKNHYSFLIITDPMANHLNSSDTGLTEKAVRQHLDNMEELLNQARRLRGK
jgi:hypothetical protein